MFWWYFSASYCIINRPLLLLVLVYLGLYKFPHSIFNSLWLWFEFKPTIMEVWDAFANTPVDILSTWTRTWKNHWRPVFKRRAGPSSNCSVGEADVLSSPAFTTKILIFHLQLEESMQFWLAFLLLSQVLESELLVAIVRATGKHFETVILEISFARFYQEEAFTGVIFRP